MNKFNFVSILLITGLSFLLACTGSDRTTPSASTIKKAIAVIQPTAGNYAEGTVTFTKVNTGIKVEAYIEGLNPGLHGFHIHELGDCHAVDATSAGGHFNPDGNPHGGPDNDKRHVGDLGNLEADENGVAHYERIDTLLSFDGNHSIIGRAVIIHSGADDFTSQPTGSAGVRVACGVIGIESE